MSARTPSSPTTRSTQRPSTDPSPLQHESEFEEELGRCCEVVNHDTDVLHPLDSHVFDDKEPDSGRGRRAIALSSVRGPPNDEIDLDQSN